jgi:hypothetical protein
MNPSYIARTRIEAQIERICEAVNLPRRALEFNALKDCLRLKVPCGPHVEVRLESRTDNGRSILFARLDAERSGCLHRVDVLELKGSFMQLSDTPFEAKCWIRDHSACGGCRWFYR